MNIHTGSVEERVKKILAEQLCISVVEMDMSADLKNRYGCDSLDQVEIAMQVEDEFDIDIPDEVMFAIKSGEQLVLTVMERV
jgi:acyl carrier protein